MGIRGTVLDWFASYLQGRTFAVEIGSSNSSARPIVFGVPQGSCLGRLVFIIYAPSGFNLSETWRGIPLLCRRHPAVFSIEI